MKPGGGDLRWMSSFAPPGRVAAIVRSRRYTGAEKRPAW